MSEATRYKTPVLQEPSGNLVKCADQFSVVHAHNYDVELIELAALREELEMARDDLVIFKGAISALGEAAKKLVVCARTAGGTAGPDKGLMDACAGVESVITLGVIARAMNEFEKLTAERDDLASRLEQARDRKNSIVDLQQRLTAAEQRNAVMTELLVACGLEFCTSEANEWEIMMREKINAALKPTESGASDKCVSDGGTCGLGGQCAECPHKESGASE